MSIYTNRIADARKPGETYTEAIIRRLGDADTHTILKESPGRYRDRVADLTEGQLREPEAPGKWSVGQLLAHHADSEHVAAWRIRMILAHDRPTLGGYDQDAWCVRLQYSEWDPQHSLTMYDVLRKDNLLLVSRATAEDMRRASIHEERGEESLEHLLWMYAGHDLVHYDQLERIIGTVQG